jgi:predicted nuclease of predicted toxin-antitoxin system
VRFLVDNQLPVALARRLAALGHEARHVLDIGLDQASDTEIWKYAARNSLVLITKDDDFLPRASLPNSAVPIVWVRLGNCRNATLLAVFESMLGSLELALQAGNRVVEIRQGRGAPKTKAEDRGT